MVTEKQRRASPHALQSTLPDGRLSSPVSMGLLLALATLGVYWLAALNGFVNYDDGDYVTSNPQVQNGLTWPGISWALTTSHASNWHPLTWLSHMLDWQIFGDRASGHHVTSILLHLANTVLLFLVLRRITGAHWRSAFVAGLFALHPLHVESVAWVSERKDVLSTFFLLLTLWAYASYAGGEEPGQKGEGRRMKDEAQPTTSGRKPYYRSKPYWLALVFFGLGLMSKPMLVTAPFLLLLLDYWPLARFALRVDATKLAFGDGSKPGPRSKRVHNAPQPSLPTSDRGAARSADFLGLLGEKAPFFVLSLISSVITYVVQQKGGAVSASLTLGQRMGNAMVSYMRYIIKMLWPVDLSVLYPHPGDWPLWEVAAAGALLLGVSLVAMLLVRRRPYLAVGWFWFLGGLLPVIGLVQVGIQSMADRYTYVPMIGLWIAAVWGLCDRFASSLNRDRCFALGATAVLLVCAGLTARQIRFWRNSETLFSRAVAVTSKNYLAYNNLGFYLAGKGRVDEALENYRKAIEINPAYEDALNNIGYTLAGKKQPAEAIPYYEAALRIRPKHVEVHNNLGNALSDLGQIPAAIEQYNFVLQEQPDHADAHNNLGIALAMQGKLDEAIPHFQAALRFKPKYASAHSNLGNAYAAQHKFDLAISEYRESLRLNPADPQAHNNLGNVLAEQNRLGEAIEQYGEALRLNTNNPEAQFNLGMALARQGKGDEASAHYREALRLKPDYAAARQQLDSLARQTGH